MESTEYVKKSSQYYDQRFGKDEVGKELNSEEQLRLENISKILERICREQEVKKVLDFGCGRGWLIDRLEGTFEKFGVDLSPGAIASARNMYPDVQFTDKDLSVDSEKLLFDQEGFDVVLSSEVIEHVQDQPSYIQNIERHILPGGHLILTTPNGNFKQDYFAGERAEWGQPYEFWLKTEDLKAMVSAVGMEVQSHYVFNVNWVLNQPMFRWGKPMLYQNKIVRLLRKFILDKERYGRFLSKQNLGLYQIIHAQKPR